ncbi:MAG: hypothetical protein H7A50_17795, partial [Akkermansiaceae bacterium]|nr:hypothetical protein [Akkermansiaceae bacterium]
MLFTIDLDTLELIASATDRRRVTQVECKRGDGVFFEVQFVRDGDPQELESGTVITFGAKAENKFDSGIVVLEDDFSFGGTSPKYTATPSLNTVELNELFLIDGDDENDPPFVDLMGEFTWRVGSGNTTSCRTFRVRVHNDVVRGDEFSPTPMPLPIGITAPITEETVTIGGDPTVSAVPVVFPTLYRDGDANG